MTRTIELDVGSGFDAMAGRVARAWRRADNGELVREDHVTFETWDALTRVMTPERFELLRGARRQPGAGIATLSRALGREETGVRADVEALAAAGLIERNGEDLSADYDEIRTTIAI